MRLISSGEWKACTAWLSMTSNIAVILLLFVLDLRDLYYKVAWVGPHESFSFRTGSTSILHAEPLQVEPSQDLRRLNSSGPMDSGWPSFLSRCENLYALGADGSHFFLSALGTNCVLGEPALSPVIPRLVMTSDQRVDAVMWASCALLTVSRRPPICFEPIVADFYGRYMLLGSELQAFMVPTAPHTTAEQELLRFLDMAMDSFPMHRVVCVEAFSLDGTTTTSTRDEESELIAPSIFGCGSPSAFRSEFVGALNPQIANLLDRMAWLTADAISLTSMRFLIRQNCFTRYGVRERSSDGALVLQSHTATNFSSFGQLYALLILIDVTLLTLNCLSSLELVQWMSFPKYRDVRSWVDQREAARSQARVARRTRQNSLLLHLPVVLRAKKKLLSLRSTHSQREQAQANQVLPRLPSGPSDRPLQTQASRVQRRRRLLATMEAMSGVTAIEEEQLYSFFSRSLYRNPGIVMITMATQLLSWLLVLPNAVVWTWSDSSHEKLQAYMSSIRCWVLVLILCNALWSCFVRVNERLAYAVTKRSFLTSIDIIGITSLVSYSLQHFIFAMSEQKWRLENQRVNDVTSFVGGFLAHGNTFQVALDSVDTTPWRVLAILYAPLARILFSSIGAIVVMLVAKALYYSRQRKKLLRRLQRQLSRRVSKISRSLSRAGSASNESIAAEESLDDDDDDEGFLLDQERAIERALAEPYRRLPLEEWLDRPIRATSLIRNALRMETVRDGTRFIRPTCYLDFGIIVKRGVIHSRFGFSDSWKSRMTVQEYMTRVEHQPPPVVETPSAASSVVPLGPVMRRSLLGRFSETEASASMPPSMQPLTAPRVSSRPNIQRKRSLHVPLA